VRSVHDEAVVNKPHPDIHCSPDGSEHGRQMLTRSFHIPPSCPPKNLKLSFFIRNLVVHDIANHV
jgi:hypothetical protein